MNVEQLLNHYGYLAIFIGSILEGETILTLAGFFVHKGYLLFLPSILCAAGGGMLGDQICFCSAVITVNTYCSISLNWIRW